LARPAKFDFIINLQAATVIGLDVPATLTARADEMIERNITCRAQSVRAKGDRRFPVSGVLRTLGPP
jgi:hypothetical protein